METESSRVKRRVIFVVDYPFSERDCTRFGVDEFLSRGYLPEVWDLSAVFLRHLASQGPSPTLRIRVTRLLRRAEIKSHCDSLADSDNVILVGGLHGHQARSGSYFMRCLYHSPSTVHALASGELMDIGEPLKGPSGITTKTFLALKRPQRFRRLISKLGIGISLLGEWSWHDPGAASLPRTIDQVWAGTSTGHIRSELLDANTTVNYIHTLDYDQLLNLQHLDPTVARRIVYIDHLGSVDATALGQAAKIPAEVYGQLIDKVLVRLERQLERKVTIAAHPGSERGQLEKLYQGREVVYGQTARLIREADLVVTSHYTTAVSWVVSVKVPLVVITSCRFERQQCLENAAMIEVLGCDSIDTDEGDRWNPSFAVDENRYANYASRYVKRPGTPELSFWSVVADFMDGQRS